MKITLTSPRIERTTLPGQQFLKIVDEAAICRVDGEDFIESIEIYVPVELFTSQEVMEIICAKD